MVGFTHIKTNGVQLHVAQAGPEAGPLVILLHGFPEFWYGWRNQIEGLAEAGFRVLAPDQRGYNLSDKPKQLGDYALDELAADVAGLIEATGRERAYVVGHDWGAMVAWWLATTQPERVEKLAILNCCHPHVLLDHLRWNFDQITRVWYIFYFQQPEWAESLSMVGGWAFWKRALSATNPPGVMGAEGLARYQEAWEQPGAVTGMIGWYRALLQHSPPRPDALRVTVPTLLLWGRLDPYFSPKVIDDSAALCTDSRLEYFEEATHWLHHEQPRRVNEALASFFGATGN